jgi:hypothetical protein
MESGYLRKGFRSCLVGIFILCQLLQRVDLYVLYWEAMIIMEALQYNCILFRGYHSICLSGVGCLLDVLSPHARGKSTVDKYP